MSAWKGRISVAVSTVALLTSRASVDPSNRRGPSHYGDTRNIVEAVALRRRGERFKVDPLKAPVRGQCCSPNRCAPAPLRRDSPVRPNRLQPDYDPDLPATADSSSTGEPAATAFDCSRQRRVKTAAPSVEVSSSRAREAPATRYESRCESLAVVLAAAPTGSSCLRSSRRSS
jgi:hypothetical protein